MKKKILLLWLCMLLTIVPAAGVWAQDAADEEAQEYYISASYVNPLYEDTVSIDEICAETEAAAAASSESGTSADSYYTSSEDAAEYMREQLVAREETISFGYQSSEEVTADDLKAIFEEAIEHTGVPDEGDYIAWQYGGYSVGASVKLSSGTYYLTVTYTMSYYTTYAQEQAVDEAVAEILQTLDLDGKSTYEKVTAIYEYICSNVTYDYDNLNDSSYLLKHTAYAAVINGTSVCQGYALLFYRLALEADIDARIIVGVTDEGEDHGWNIVKIGSKYYYADATWDAVRTEYEYFLKGSTDFGTDHITGDISADIVASYSISEDDYDPSTAEDDEVLSGLNKVDGVWGYYVDGVLDTSYTGLASNSAGTWYVEDGIVDFGYTGLAEIDGNLYYFSGSRLSSNTGLYKFNGTWYYFESGVVDFDYTGLASNSSGTWYVEDSIVDFGYTGLAEIDGNLYYFSGSRLSSNTGLYKFNGTWYYFESGVVDFDYTGLVKNSSGWWYVEDSIVDFGYTGLVGYNGSYWYVYNSNVKFVTGLYKINGTWYYISNGAAAFSYTGLAVNSAGTWYVEGGIVDFGYTGLAEIDGNLYYFSGSRLSSNTGLYKFNGTWYYFESGVVDFDYTGLATNSSGTWYVVNSVVDFSYTGTVTIDGITYTIKNSKVSS